MDVQLSGLVRGKFSVFYGWEIVSGSVFTKEINLEKISDHIIVHD